MCTWQQHVCSILQGQRTATAGIKLTEAVHAWQILPQAASPCISPYPHAPAKPPNPPAHLPTLVPEPFLLPTSLSPADPRPQRPPPPLCVSPPHLPRPVLLQRPRRFLQRPRGRCPHWWPEVSITLQFHLQRLIEEQQPTAGMRAPEVWRPPHALCSPLEHTQPFPELVPLCLQRRTSRVPAS